MRFGRGLCGLATSGATVFAACGDDLVISSVPPGAAFADAAAGRYARAGRRRSRRRRRPAGRGRGGRSPGSGRGRCLRVFDVPLQRVLLRIPVRRDDVRRVLRGRGGLHHRVHRGSDGQLPVRLVSHHRVHVQADEHRPLSLSRSTRSGWCRCRRGRSSGKRRPRSRTRTCRQRTSCGT